jgi:hypothetical protein
MREHGTRRANFLLKRREKAFVTGFFTRLFFFFSLS